MVFLSSLARRAVAAILGPPVLAVVAGVAVLAGVLVAGAAPAASGAAPAAGAAGAARLGSAAPAASAGSAGYWLVAADGGIFTFGGVPFDGSGGSLRLQETIAAMAATPDGHGYWLAGTHGGVYAFGDAVFAGSIPGLPARVRPAAPVVAILPSASGHGYLLVTVDGGVYGFGDAHFAGSLGGHHLGAPIVGAAATPDAGGYWLVGKDGSVFSFGDAAFAGSANTLHLGQSFVGMTGDPAGGGYWLVTAAGGVYSFGAAFYGSMGTIGLPGPVDGIAASPTGRGYWLVAPGGGVFSFGDAPFRGSLGGQALNQPIVAITAGRAIDPYPQGGTGYDISFPQCGQAYPSPPVGFAIVGVNDGQAFTDNPCLASEAAWAGPKLSLYINLNAPPAGSTAGQTGPAGTCVGNDTGCIAYNYGFNAAVHAFSYATTSGISNAAVWWLDVETANTWDTSLHNNAETIQGALDALGSEGVLAGIYSTSYQWGLIAGRYAPAKPIWVATGSDVSVGVQFCDPIHGFGGGTTWLTQFGAMGVPFDQDYACPLPG